MKDNRGSSLNNMLMNGIGEIISGIVDGLSHQDMICGKYSDGTPRSLIDAIRGDYISPKKKKKLMKASKKAKKDKKKLKKMKKDGFIKSLKKIKKQNKKLMKGKK